MRTWGVVVICLALAACRKSGDSCEGKPFCLDHGMCASDGVGCKIRDDKDCQQSSDCRVKGLCAKVDDHRCGPTSQADCDKAAECQGDHRTVMSDCTFNAKKKRCESDQCMSSGLCVVGSKVTSVTDYAAAGEAPDLDVQYGADSHPGSPDDCKDSVVCKSQGRCSVSADGKSCEIGSDADCAVSPSCKGEGKCKYAGGECVEKDEASCRASAVCTDDGRCAFADGKCVAISDEECKKSTGCASGGRCTFARDTKYCVVQSDADCRGSTDCKDHGLCKLEGFSCRITAADCKKSTGCKAEGLCQDAGYDVCSVTPQTCKASDACKKEGRCDASGWTGCVKN